MRKPALAMLIVCLLILPALQAAAQYGDEPSPKLGVKIGVFSPTGSDFDGKLKSLWRSLGAEYALSSDALNRPTALISGIAVSSDGDRAEVSMLGIQYEKRFYVKQDAESSLYYGGGVGYYSIKAKTRDYVWEGWTNDSGGKLGASAVVGYDMKSSYYGELRYSMPGKLDGLDFSGFSANLGIRMNF